MRLLLTILLLLLFTTSAWAGGVAMTGGGSLMNDPGRAYHISTSGNDSNSGTRRSPWLTIGKIATQVAAGVEPGDRFLLKSGDSWTAVASTANIDLSGAHGAPHQNVTIGSYGVGADPIITGVGVAGTWHDVFDLSGSTYITLQDINIIYGAKTRSGVTGNAATYSLGIHHINIIGMTFDNTVEDQVGAEGNVPETKQVDYHLHGY